MSPFDPAQDGPAAWLRGATMGRLLRLQALSLRVQLEEECAKARKRKADKSTLERLTIRTAVIDQHGAPPLRVDAPSGGWIKIPISAAAAIAASRLPESEKPLYAEFEAERPRLLASARGERGKWNMEREIERRRAVFLKRFFPVPEPGEWSPGFWTPQQYDLLEQMIRDRLAAIENPVEPLWWPDGWKEAMER